MNRREFCRRFSAAAGTAVVASWLQACRGALPTPTAVESATHPPDLSPTSTGTPMPSPTGSPTSPAATETPQEAPTPQPTPTTEPTAAAGISTVALVRTTNRADGLRRALALLGVNPVRGNRVLLKPNFNSADPAPGATDPLVLQTLLQELQEMGTRTITIGERSGMGDTRQVMERKGIFDLASKSGVETVVFDELGEKDWVLRRSADHHWAAGFAVPRILLDAECVVQTCNLKTHRYGGHFTLSLKNSVGFAAKTVGPGGYNYMSELHSSPYQRQMIAEINTAYEPGLIVVDGVQAFVDGGPAQGTQAPAKVVLAGTDRVAVDAVGVAILRLLGTTEAVSHGPIFAQEQIARAVELGLGVALPHNIHLLTDDAPGAAYADRVRQELLRA